MSKARTFNVYCDESCHLEHDHILVMAWGAVYCQAGGGIVQVPFLRIRAISIPTSRYSGWPRSAR